MANTPTLTTYIFRVAFGDPENPRVIDVRTVGRDVQQAEQFFAKKGWGKTESRPMTAAAVTAWAALHRAGQYPGDFDAFEAEYLEVSPQESVPVRPTDAAPDPA